MMLLLAQIDAPPIDGVSGWVIGFAITTIVSIVSNVWLEYRRRAESRDRKELEKESASAQRTTQLEMAKLQAAHDQTKRNEDRWNRMFDRMESQNKELMVANQAAMEVNNTQNQKLHELMNELQETRTLKNQEIAELKTRVQTLENEVKSLERSRDDARAACKRSEETSPTT
jgi:uncharacterized membrane protein YhiD involved in acid resistance